MTARTICPTTIKIDQSREEKREAFGQDAMHVWAEHQEKGLHVTGEEIAAWLGTWGEEHEQAVPKCHR